MTVAVLVRRAGFFLCCLFCAPIAQAQDAITPESRGLARSALLASLLGGEAILSLEATDHPPDLMEPLRLDESVAFALKNNFEVKAAEAKNDAAGWEMATAFGGYLPTITYSRGTGKEVSAPASYSVNDVQVENSKHKRWDTSFSVIQPIINLSLISDILMQSQAKTSADLEKLGTRERVALQTISAYLKIVQAHLFMRFAENYKKRLDELNTLMGSRVDGGGAAQADLDRIKARSVSAQSALIETRSEYTAAMDEFRRLTGVTPLRLQIPALLLPYLPESADVALGRANAANPDYLLSLSQVDVQEWEALKAYSRVLPKVNFEFTKTRSWNAGGVGLGATTGTDQVFPYQNEERAMVVTTWTLSGGTEFTQGLTASAKAREATYKSMDTRARIEELVRVSFNALAAADARIPVLEQAVQSNNRVVEAFEEQYRNGSRPLFDMLDAYERHYSSQLDLVRVLLAETVAAYQVRRQMGELVPALKESELRAQPATPP